MTSCGQSADVARAAVEAEVRIVQPRPGHAEPLARLSRAFVGEQPWASTIPIGQMTEASEALSRLCGENVAAVRLAETGEGEVVGYVGVYRHADLVDISILVHRDYRRRGLGRRLVERAFDALPEGLEVEAWVASSNEASLAAMPAMGFVLDRMVKDQGRMVHVYTRMA